jgi:hypothetical protein
MSKTAVQAELPQELVNQARLFVADGWAANFDELLAEALRRFMESHTARLTEEFVMDDVKWGIHGTD